MAVDSTRAVRRACLAALKASPVAAIVPAPRIYGQQTPLNADGSRKVEWPFVLFGSLFGAPLRASCVDGVDLEGAVHGFAKDRYAGSNLVETAEDHASRLGAAIAAALDGKRLSIEGGTLAIRWTGPRLLVDGPDAFHTVQSFRFRCLTA